MVQRKKSRILSFLLGICLAVGLLSGIPMSVHAEEEEKTVACLGTNAIKAPTPPSSAESEWQGSYVWYGQFYSYKNNQFESLKYRVLSPDTTDFGGRTMLVDCDQIITNNGGSQYLNGSGFLEKAGFFTESEKSAIANSVIESYEIDYSQYEDFSDYMKTAYKNYTALNGEKIFYLDMIDLLNPAYGFSNTAGPAVNREKKFYDQINIWWTRSKDVTNHGAFIDKDGSVKVRDKEIINTSPAFNINLENIIFSSVIPGTGNAGADGTEYKLTLFDEGLSIALQDEETVSVSDDIVKVPYCISGNNKDNTTQVSVLILDKAYNANDTSNTNILYYGKMNNSQGFSTTGTGTFSLPEDLYLDDWGTEYFVYMLAEDVNGEKETDYACYPVEISAPQSSEVIYGEDDIIYSIDAPAVDYDGNPHSGSVNVTKPESGAVIKYGTVKGVYDLDECPKYIEPGNHRVYYQITAEGYNTATGSFQVKINKLDSKIIKHPVPVEKLYAGDVDRELIKPGTAEGGTILYSKDGGRSFSENIPTGAYLHQKEYSVTYYVKGDERHNNSEQYTIAVSFKATSVSNFESEIEEGEGYYNYLKDNDDYSQIVNTLKNAIDTANEQLNDRINNNGYLYDDYFYSLIDAVESAKEVVDTIDRINAIPSLDKIAASDRTAIENARGAYDSLTDDQKAKVKDETLETLVEAEATLKDILDTIAANEVTDQINAIPSVDKIAASDRTAIENARGAYDSLTDDQKAKVKDETLDTLVEAEATLKDILDTIAANEVTDQINAIPSVDKIAASDRTAIENARGAYDTLTADQKAKISDNTLKVLTDAEKALEAAEKKVVADKAAADSAIAKINSLPAGDKVSTTDKAAIEAARKAYDALTADQKKLVGSDVLKKLTDSEKTLAIAESKKDDPPKNKYSNEWINGKWYDADGKQTYAGTLQWKNNATGWWVEDTEGWYPTDQWQKIDGKWYYFTADGYMDYSEYRDGCWLGADGAWDENYAGGHWMSDSSGWWYADNSGWYPKSQWLWIDGVQYYFDASGYMV